MVLVLLYFVRYEALWRRAQLCSEPTRGRQPDRHPRRRRGMLLLLTFKQSILLSTHPLTLSLPSHPLTRSPYNTVLCCAVLCCDPSPAQPSPAQPSPAQPSPAQPSSCYSPTPTHDPMCPIPSHPDPPYSRWHPAGNVNLHLNCSSYSFAAGPEASVPLLRYTDVLVSVHGGDLINGFVLHAGASVLEIMPVHVQSCPCHMFRELYAAETGRILHYQAASKNASFAVSTAGGVRGTFNSDLVMPVSVLESVLATIVAVNGRPDRYSFRRFNY